MTQHERIEAFLQKYYAEKPVSNAEDKCNGECNGKCKSV